MAPGPPFLGLFYILFTDIQECFERMTKLSMLICISSRSSFGQSNILSKYPSLLIRKVLLIDKFLMAERSYFLHRKIFVTIFFALSLKFSFIFYNLLSILTPNKVKIFAYLNATSSVVGFRSSSLVPILIILVLPLLISRPHISLRYKLDFLLSP